MPTPATPAPATSQQARRSRTSLTDSISQRTSSIARSLESAADVTETNRTLESISTALKSTRHRLVDSGDQSTRSAAASPRAAQAQVQTPGYRPADQHEAAMPVAASAGHGTTENAQQSANQQSGDPQSRGWSVGDLLTRASKSDFEDTERQADADAEAPPDADRPDTQNDSAGIDIQAMAAAMSLSAAAAIWHRLHNGQHGVMARSIYTPEGRATFDETVERYGQSASVRATIDRYLNDFEQAMDGAEQDQQDPATIRHTLTSEAGRVYLFLAHASGRLT